MNETEVQYDYLTGSDEDIAGCINDVLEKCLIDRGIDVKILTDDDFKANARVVETKTSLEYYWGEELLFSTEPMMTTKGVRVTYE